jgi:hypothetical protein
VGGACERLRCVGGMAQRGKGREGWGALGATLREGRCVVVSRQESLGRTGCLPGMAEPARVRQRRMVGSLLAQRWRRYSRGVGALEHPTQSQGEACPPWVRMGARSSAVTSAEGPATYWGWKGRRRASGGAELVVGSRSVVENSCRRCEHVRCIGGARHVLRGQ